MLLHVVNNITEIEHVKGKPKSFRSRYIRDTDRLDLGKSVSDMSYPSKEFHRRLANLDEKCFLAGNLKDVPMSKSVVKQCAYEYQQSILVDEDLIQSIQILKEKFISKLQSKSIPGFIQFFSIQPFTIALWTQSDVELFHKMSAEHSLVVDATGSIASKLSEKEFFYFAFLSYDKSVKTEPVAHIEILTDLSTTNTKIHSYALPRRRDEAFQLHYT